MTDALRVTDLKVNYGGIQAVKGISLNVGQGEIVALIGANGAGKTSTLKAIVRLIASQGQIDFFGAPAGSLATHQIAARGVSLVPEGRAIFGNMSVRENLEMGAFLHRDATERKHHMERVFALFPRLSERLKQDGSTLSGGEQQMLAIGRAMMSQPKLLLLDEPSLGLAPKLVSEIFAAIRTIAADGLSILLVEQNTRLALKTAGRAYVLVTGEVALSGVASELRDDPRVQSAYLGGDPARTNG
jgi:branched-chain amino acid transport system ATP-binding protein